MLKQGFKIQIFNQTDHCPKKKKEIGLMKDELGGQIMKEFVGVRAKTCRYLKDNNDEDKKAKDYKNCLKPARIERKINYLEKDKN